MTACICCQESRLNVHSHLLLPLFSSVVFVLGMMLVKTSTMRGASPWTGTCLANLWLALLWGIPAVLQQSIVPPDAWGQAAVIGGLFVLGQLFTYLAFQYGDVSVATPIFGIKVLMVAALSSVMSGELIPSRVWVAAALATIGVVLVQSTNGRIPTRVTPADSVIPRDRRGLTIVMALLAAVALSLFDVLLQKWGSRWNSREFLPVAFAATGLFSLIFLPWVDRPGKLRQLDAVSPMLFGTFLMAVQAVSMSYALATYGDATRVNIVYALRGLWGVLLAWMLARWFYSNESLLAPRIMLVRLLGAGLLTAAVVVSLFRA